MATTTPAPPPLREVRLYGHLGATFGRLHQLAVTTASEAVQALCVVLPGFERAFLGPDGASRYHVYVGRGQARAPITLEHVADPVGRAEPICIVPLIGGAKSGFATALLGAALIFAAPYLAGAVGTSLGIGAAGIAYAGCVMVGRALVIGGVIQLLSPQRKGGASTAAENKPSYAFDGPVNTTTEGVPVPLAYGRVFAGGATVSSGLSTSDQADAAAPAPTPAPAQTLPAEQPLDPGEAGS
jgi:predicted phage tail protein